MGFGEGFGKAILFNEHFVVYGIPGIASAIGLTTTAEANDQKNNDGIVIDDQRDAAEGYKEGYVDTLDEALTLMCKKMGIDRYNANLDIKLSGNLYAAGGIGASAASCVAIARALNDHLNLGFDDEKINEIAYEGEKAYAGSPSGIDNTASTFGGLIEFQKKKDGAQMNRMNIKEPIRIVMGSTGVIVHTKQIVADVRKRKEKNPDKFNKLFKQSEDLIPKAKQALKFFDIERVGKLMNEANSLLEAIGISSEKLEKLINIARDNGALGAKITGGGVGGFMLALTPQKEIQEKVASAMEKQGFRALRTTIG